MVISRGIITIIRYLAIVVTYPIEIAIIVYYVCYVSVIVFLKPTDIILGYKSEESPTENLNIN